MSFNFRELGEIGVGLEPHEGDGGEPVALLLGPVDKGSGDRGDEGGRRRGNERGSGEGDGGQHVLVHIAQCRGGECCQGRSVRRGIDVESQCRR